MCYGPRTKLTELFKRRCEERFRASAWSVVPLTPVTAPGSQLPFLRAFISSTELQMAEVVGSVGHKVTAEAGDPQSGSPHALRININQKKKRNHIRSLLLLNKYSKHCILRKKKL